MSLRVWLPLTSDLHNQGLSNATPDFNANNSSIATNGKLGSCLKTTSIGEINTNCNVDINTSSLSFGGWYKFNKAEIQAVINTITYTSTNKISTGNLIGNDNYGGIGLIFTTNDLYSNNKVLTTLNVFSTIRTASVNQSTSGKTLDFDVWTHLFTVWNRNTLTLSFYVNGELFNSKTFSTFSDATTRNLFINYTHIYGGNGVAISPPSYVNDLRIYDHALSQKQVKLLSQGLVAHYTLGDRSIQQMNNCYSYPTFNTSSASGGWSHWGGSGHIGTYGQNTNINYIFRAGQPYSHWVANGSGATYNYLVYQSPAFEGGTRSLCCIIKHENGLPITNSICYPAWNARSGGTPNNAWTSIISLDNGFYLCRCENIQQDGSNDLVGIYVTAGNKIYISECYLENDRTCCSDMFGDTTTVYDTSGYNYHGTRSGTLTVNSNTPRYSVSTQFSSGSHINISLVAGGFANTYTFAWWGYIVNYTGHMMWGFSNGNRLNLFMSNSGNNFYWNTGDGNNNPFGSIKPSDYKNAWHHFAVTGDGTTSKLYIDGEFKANATTYRGITGTTIYMNGWDSGTSYNCNGKLSDFRLYTTCLSADDIKSLYQVGASIDKSGNMYAYEFNEV